MPLLAHTQTHTHTHTHTHTTTCNNNSFLVANNNERKFYFEWFQLTHYMCACKWEVNATALFVLVVPTMCVCSCYMCSRTDKIFSSLSRNSHTHWFGFSRNCSFRLTDLRATYLLTTFMQLLSCCLLHVNDFDSVTFFVIIQAWITSIGDTVCFFTLSY